jgi:hypothetical protein
VCNEHLQAVIPLPSVATTQLSHAFRVKVATPSFRVTQIARSGLKHTTRGPILALNGLLVAQKLTLQPFFLQSFLFLHSFHELYFHLGTFVVSHCWLSYFAFFFIKFFACPFDSLSYFGKAMSSSFGSFLLRVYVVLALIFLSLKAWILKIC